MTVHIAMPFVISKKFKNFVSNEIWALAVGFQMYVDDVEGQMRVTTKGRKYFRYKRKGPRYMQSGYIEGYICRNEET